MRPQTASGGLLLDLLERGPILLELSQYFAESERNHGRIVFVGGEAGIGKTWLVRRFAELIRGRATLLIGSCDPLSTPRPLGPLLDVVDRIENHDIDLSSGKDEIFRNVLNAISRSKETTVIAFEDVHWADEATLDLLRFIARRIEDRRAMLIATFRDDEVGDLHPLRQVLGDVATAPGVRRITIAPLTRHSVRAMAAGSGIDVEELYRQTGGNPFYVSEVLATPDGVIPPTVRDAVIARVARLSESGRSALETASVIGFRSEPWLLSAMVGQDASGIEECLESGVLIADDDGAYAFRHEIARMVILDTIAPHRRADINRRILDSLRNQQTTEINAARLSHHADEADDVDAVLSFAPQAARRASQLNAHRDAIAQYQRALKFVDRLAANDRAVILDEYARECAATDRYDEAIETAREAVKHWRETGDRFREGETLGFLGGCLVSTGRAFDAQPLCTRSIDLLEQFPSGAALAEAYVRQARIDAVNCDYISSRSWSKRALDIANEVGDAKTTVLALHRLGSAMLLDGDDSGETILKEALAMALESHLPVEASGIYVSLASNWLERHEPRRAEPYLNESLAFADEYQLSGFLSPMLGFYALFKLYSGAWDAVEEPARSVVNRQHSSVVGRILSLTALGRLYARRGDERAWQLLDDALELAKPTRVGEYVLPVHAARAEGAWLQGDIDKAKSEARAGLELAMSKRHPWFAGELLWWLSAAGESVDIPEWVASVFAMQIAGDARGAHDEWTRRGFPYEAALALLGSDDESGLRNALAVFEEMGAERAAKHTRRRLRELGVKGIPRGPHESTRTNAAGLTRRETEIVQLISDGMRNSEIAQRLFLSPKTVDHHVSSILSKLGVKTRAQVGHAAERLGIRKNGEPGTKK